MIFYLSIGQLQNEFSRRFLLQKRIYHSPSSPNIEKLFLLNDLAFLDAIQHLYYSFSSEELLKDTDYDMFSEFNDMTMISLFWRTENLIHIHDCFEIDYVYRGKCELTFLDEKGVLQEGEFCILSPYDQHTTCLLMEKSCVFPILVKEEPLMSPFYPYCQTLIFCPIFSCKF